MLFMSFASTKHKLKNLCLLSSTDIQPKAGDGCSLSAAALVAEAPAATATTERLHKVNATTALSWEAVAALALSWEGAVMASQLTRSWCDRITDFSLSPPSATVPVVLGAHSPSLKFEALSSGSYPKCDISWEATATTAPVSGSPLVPIAVRVHSHSPKFEGLTQGTVQNATLSRKMTATTASISDSSQVSETELHSPTKLVAAVMPAGWLRESLQSPNGSTLQKAHSKESMAISH